MGNGNEPDFWSGISETWSYPEKQRTWNSMSIANWALILCMRGVGTIRSEEGEITLSQADVVLINPGVAHRYQAGEQWELLWIHFMLPLETLENLVWREDIPHMRLAHLTPSLYAKVKMVMNEAYMLNMNRPKGWYNYALALLNATVLRIDNARADTDKAPLQWLTLASEMLSAPQSVSVEEIAEKCGMSRTSFFREFHKQTGYTPSQYRENLKMRKAEQVLLRTDQPISQIAESLGFSSVFYFSLRFKARYHYSPRQYRELHSAQWK